MSGDPATFARGFAGIFSGVSNSYLPRLRYFERQISSDQDGSDRPEPKRKCRGRLGSMRQVPACDVVGPSNNYADGQR